MKREDISRKIITTNPLRWVFLFDIVKYNLYICHMENNEVYEELENFENVRYRMKNEGIDYCFKHYSNFEEIKDEKFHELRNKFLISIDEIQNYVDGKINELNDKINEI